MECVTEVPASPNPPRIVRVSNLHSVRQVKWLAIRSLPVMAACASYLLLHRGRPHEDDPLWSISLGGLMLIGIFGLFIPSLQLLVAGTWIADKRGIEFVPYLPRVRRWRFLLWSEVERVRCMPIVARLQGGDSEVWIQWKELRPADADALKARVVASLGTSFDLSLPPPPARERPSFRRIFVLSALPAGSALIAYAVAMRHPEYAPLVIVAIMAWIPVLYAVVIVVAVRRKRDPHAPARWRPRNLPAAAS